jgi:hypothetical protein
MLALILFLSVYILAIVLGFYQMVTSTAMYERIFWGVASTAITVAVTLLLEKFDIFSFIF